MAWLIFSWAAYAQDDASALAEKLRHLRYQRGDISLLNGVATLHLPPRFRDLDPHDADVIIVDACQSPPELGNTLGLIVPPGVEMPAGWAIRIEYSADGYVKDQDADQINYDVSLNRCRKQARKIARNVNSAATRPTS